eukprot:scaffold5074_cov162-Pinguiococcus_pyrenoidosus.AAC.1
MALALGVEHWKVAQLPFERTLTERKGITGTSKTRRKLEVADRENPSSCPSRAPSSASTSVRFFQAALKGVCTSDFIPEAAQGPCRGLKE